MTVEEFSRRAVLATLLGDLPACRHERCSGQNRGAARGRLTSWLVCDECGESLGILPHATFTLRCENRGATYTRTYQPYSQEDAA